MNDECRMTNDESMNAKHDPTMAGIDDNIIEAWTLKYGTDTDNWCLHDVLIAQLISEVAQLTLAIRGLDLTNR